MIIEVAVCEHRYSEFRPDPESGNDKMTKRGKVNDTLCVVGRLLDTNILINMFMASFLFDSLMILLPFRCHDYFHLKYAGATVIDPIYLQIKSLNCGTLSPGSEIYFQTFIYYTENYDASINLSILAMATHTFIFKVPEMHIGIKQIGRSIYSVPQQRRVFFIC